MPDTARKSMFTSIMQTPGATQLYEAAQVIREERGQHELDPIHLVAAAIKDTNRRREITEIFIGYGIPTDGTMIDEAMDAVRPPQRFVVKKDPRASVSLYNDDYYGLLDALAAKYERYIELSARMLGTDSRPKPWSLDVEIIHEALALQGAPSIIALHTIILRSRS